MNATVKTGLWAGLLMVLTWPSVVFSLPANGEPSYRGESLHEWMEAYDSWRWISPEALAADDALRHLGAQAVPSLLNQATNYSTYYVPRQWYHAFWILQGKAESAIPTLTRWLSDPTKEEMAAECLGNIGATGLPVLVNALETTNAELRGLVVVSLLSHYPWGGRNINYGQTFDPESYTAVQNACKRVVPRLIRCIENPTTDTRTRNAAICILGDFHQQPEVVVPLLLKFLEATNHPSRRSAALHLEYFSSEAQKIEPALTRLTEDNDPKMREIATYSLEKIKAATTNNSTH